MKVKDLIKELKKQNQDLNVVVFNGEFWNTIEEIEIGEFDLLYNSEYYQNNKGKTKALYLV